MSGKQCKKCGGSIPKWIVVENKKRNLQSRKYCFECSPFGQHNTSVLEKYEKHDGLKICPTCNKPHTQKGSKCFNCYFKSRKGDVLDKVAEMAGNSCWFCGYDKCKRNLAFHHVDPSTKAFTLTTRELMLKWERVELELRKCVLACHNCHGEIHEGLISHDKVIELWVNHWAAVP